MKHDLKAGTNGNAKPAAKPRKKRTLRTTTKKETTRKQRAKMQKKESQPKISPSLRMSRPRTRLEASNEGEKTHLMATMTKKIRDYDLSLSNKPPQVTDGV